MSHLLHPELFAGSPFPGKHVANSLDTRAEASLAGPSTDRPITIGVRTLNEADRLEMLLADIQAQHYDGEIEVIVIDNESTDGTTDVARNSGATVIPLAREAFTYPRSMNLAMEAASSDNVFLTVGHAKLTTDRLLAGGMQQTDRSTVAGAFAHALPNDNASRTEKIISLGNRAFMNEKEVKKAGMGVLGAVGAMISKAAWQELGKFDERYASGGEDTALAGMMLRAGYLIVDEPLLHVHHTHGLGFVDTAKQWIHWAKTVKGPVELDLAKITARRPDLDFS